MGETFCQWIGRPFLMTSKKRRGKPNPIWVATAPAPFEVSLAVFFALYGVLSLIFGGAILPGSLEIWSWLIQTNWQASVGLGGVLTAVGRWKEADKVEQSGLVALGWGCFSYAVVLSFMGGAGAIVAIGLLVAFTAGAGIRWWVLHKGQVAQKVATIIQSHIDHNGDSPT